jgi:hypothetical protein
LEAQGLSNDVTAATILVAKLQHGECPGAIQDYMSQFDDTSIQRHINTAVQGFAILFYAAQINNDEMIRLIVGYGTDVNIIPKSTISPF